jgi:outer membrane protein OmpA-like peptidoglycan-associated protein
MLSTSTRTALEGQQRIQLVKTFVVYFSPGSIDPGRSGTGVVEVAVKAIPESSETVVSIVGHCDGAEAMEHVSDRGVGLSRSRAEAIATLIAKLGATPDTIAVSAKGNALPLANRNRNSDPLARRVTIEIAVVV